MRVSGCGGSGVLIDSLRLDLSSSASGWLLEVALPVSFSVSSE